MANETRVTGISEFVPTIWEGALMHIRHNTVMPRLVRTFMNQRGFASRAVTEYAEGSVSTGLGELEDLSPQVLTRSLLAQLTPQESGAQYIITDRRIETDSESVLADAIGAIGYSMGKSLEQTLLGHFTGLTGGSVGTANAALTWANIYEGRARLAAAGVPAPYNVVLHEYQWYDLSSVAGLPSLNFTTTGAAAPLKIRDELVNRYYVGSIGDLNFYVTSLLTIDANDDATGAIFNSNALALDMRRGLRVELERDASLRSTEVNATMVYASGLWRPSWGVKLISDASALGSAVSTASDIIMFGTVDDATASSGQDVVLNFVVVNNHATQISTGIAVTITMPSGSTYVDDEVSQGSYNSTTKVWTVGSLAPGQSARLKLTADVTATGNFVGTVTAVTPADGSAGTTGNIAVTVS